MCHHLSCVSIVCVLLPSSVLKSGLVQSFDPFLRQPDHNQLWTFWILVLQKTSCNWFTTGLWVSLKLLQPQPDQFHNLQDHNCSPVQIGCSSSSVASFFLVLGLDFKTLPPLLSLSAGVDVLALSCCHGHFATVAVLSMLVVVMWSWLHYQCYCWVIQVVVVVVASSTLIFIRWLWLLDASGGWSKGWWW